MESMNESPPITGHLSFDDGGGFHQFGGTSSDLEKENLSRKVEIDESWKMGSDLEESCHTDFEPHNAGVGVVDDEQVIQELPNSVNQCIRHKAEIDESCKMDSNLGQEGEYSWVTNFGPDNEVVEDGGIMQDMIHELISDINQVVQHEEEIEQGDASDEEGSSSSNDSNEQPDILEEIKIFEITREEEVIMVGSIFRLLCINQEAFLCQMHYEWSLFTGNPEDHDECQHHHDVWPGYIVRYICKLDNGDIIPDYDLIIPELGFHNFQQFIEVLSHVHVIDQNIMNEEANDEVNEENERGSE